MQHLVFVKGKSNLEPYPEHIENYMNKLNKYQYTVKELHTLPAVSVNTNTGTLQISGILKCYKYQDTFPN